MWSCDPVCYVLWRVKVSTYILQESDDSKQSDNEDMFRVCVFLVCDAALVNLWNIKYLNIFFPEGYPQHIKIL